MQPQRACSPEHLASIRRWKNSEIAGKPRPGASGWPASVDNDVVVIGGGAAGLAAAGAAARAKVRVLLVAEDEIGGDCTFAGCVPSKTSSTPRPTARRSPRR
ncbi:MAG: FAD-dependent oxidoreductase [Pseudonocardiaceae bacterium]